MQEMTSGYRETSSPSSLGVVKNKHDAEYTPTDSNRNSSLFRCDTVIDGKHHKRRGHVQVAKQLFW
jgi:hypothetical protein